MRKTVIFTMAACMLLSGCGVRIAIPGEESAAEYSWGIFDETDPDGVYTVELDSPGEYQMLFYAEYHVGSVEIVPLEDEM